MSFKMNLYTLSGKGLCFVSTSAKKKVLCWTQTQVSVNTFKGIQIPEDNKLCMGLVINKSWQSQLWQMYVL